MAYCVDESEVYLLMKLVEGASLRRIIHEKIMREKFGLTDNEKHHIALQICKAVDFIHRHPSKILHRDIKPANILVSWDRHVELCDLGLATANYALSALNSTAGKQMTAPGTLPYMGPELIIGMVHHIPTKCSDIWALACTIYELYARRKAFCVNNRSELVDTFLKSDFPNLDIDGISKSLQTLINKTFMVSYSNDKKTRPSASEFVEAYEMILKSDKSKVQKI